MNWRLRRRHGVLIAIAALSVSACTTGPAEDVALPPQPTFVEVTMKEYGFAYEPPASAGRVVFTVHNAGRSWHKLTLIPLAEDVPPIGEQVRGNDRRAVTAVAGMAPQPPGDTQSFAIDLQPGVRYALVCFLRDGGRSHAVQGMASEFRAARPPLEGTDTNVPITGPAVGPSSPRDRLGGTALQPAHRLEKA